MACRFENAYDRCAYLNCNNGRYATGHRLFRFPKSSDPRLHYWIRYSGNKFLRNYASTTLRHAGICAEHFDPECFTDESRVRLRRRSIPNPYNATKGEVKPSSTLLAQINSHLPKKQKKIQEMADSEELEVEFEAHSSQKDTDAEDIKPFDVKPLLIQAQSPKPIKTLQKLKILKIEKRILNTNKIMILQRCENPQTCPAKGRTLLENGKPKPHFHKFYVTNTAKTKPVPNPYSKPAQKREPDDNNSVSTEKKIESFEEDENNTNFNNKTKPTKTFSKLDEKRKPDDNNSVLAQKVIESFENDENITNSEPRKVEITKGKEEPFFQMEKIHIDLAKPSPKKEEPSTTSRCTGAPEDLMPNWQAIQEARAAAESEKEKRNSPRKPTSNEFIEDYWKSKEGCSFDRCVYINCKNGRFTTGAHLFRFPQINDPRLTTWIKNAGNPKMLYWTWSTMRRAGICADHFSRECFFNDTRNRLLRTAVPKPFYLEENAPVDEKNFGNMSPEDLLKVCTIFENQCKNKKQEAESVPIDLPSEESLSPGNTVVKYSFEEPEIEESDNEVDISKEKNVRENEKGLETFENITIKTERPDEMEDDESDGILSTPPSLVDVKEEPKDDPLDEVPMEFDAESEDENVEDIDAIEQKKARLCKVIEQFSTKLKNAQIRRHQLYSRLRAHDIKIQSFGNDLS